MYAVEKMEPFIMEMLLGVEEELGNKLRTKLSLRVQLSPLV